MTKAGSRGLIAGIGLALTIGVVVWLAGREPERTPDVRAPEAVAPPPVPPPPAAAPPPSAPPPSRPAPTSSAAPTASAPAAPFDPAPGSTFAGNITEPVLMARLREAAASDPELAIKLARAGNRRFPDSADAPERHSILIHALVAQGQPSKARGEAEYMVNHYVDSKWVHEIEQFTGAHRHRNIRVTDGGLIQYE